MTIYTNTLIVSGSLGNSDLSANSSPALNVKSDINIDGNVMTKGRLDVGTTAFMTMRASSNIPMAGSNEHFVVDSDMALDDTASDITSLATAMQSNNIPSIWDPQTGIYTVPVDGLYHLQLQGSFSNSASVASPRNGVYFYFVNHSFPTARIAANINDSDIVYTNTSAYLLAGDQVKPTYFSNDSNATLLGSGETYVNFSIAATFTPTHSNYYRQSTAAQ